MDSKSPDFTPEEEKTPPSSNDSGSGSGAVSGSSVKWSSLKDWLVNFMNQEGINFPKKVEESDKAKFKRMKDVWSKVSDRKFDQKVTINVDFVTLNTSKKTGETVLAFADTKDRGFQLLAIPAPGFGSNYFDEIIKNSKDCWRATLKITIDGMANFPKRMEGKTDKQLAKYGAGALILISKLEVEMGGYDVERVAKVTDVGGLDMDIKLLEPIPMQFPRGSKNPEPVVIKLDSAPADKPAEYINKAISMICALLNGCGGDIWYGVPNDEYSEVEGVVLDCEDFRKQYSNRVHLIFPEIGPPSLDIFKFHPRITDSIGQKLKKELCLIRIRVPRTIHPDVSCYVEKKPVDLMWTRQSAQSICIADAWTENTYNIKRTFQWALINNSRLKSDKQTVENFVNELSISICSPENCPPLPGALPVLCDFGDSVLFRHIEEDTWNDFKNPGDDIQIDMKRKKEKGHTSARTHPIDYLRDERKHLTAFLNTGEGGRLLFGVRDDGIAVGIRMDDEAKKKLNDGLLNEFRKICPPVPEELWKLKYVKVEVARDDMIVTDDNFLVFDDEDIVKNEVKESFIGIPIDGGTKRVLCWKPGVQIHDEAIQILINNHVVEMIPVNSAIIKFDNLFIIELHFMSICLECHVDSDESNDSDSDESNESDSDHQTIDFAFLLNAPSIQIARESGSESHTMTCDEILDRCSLNRIELPSHYVDIGIRNCDIQLDHNSNVVIWHAIYGPPGSGKTTLANAIASMAHEQGYKTVFVPLWGNRIAGSGCKNPAFDAMKQALPQISSGSVTAQASWKNKDVAKMFELQVMDRNCVIIWDDVTGWDGKLLKPLVRTVRSNNRDSSRNRIIITTSVKKPDVQGIEGILEPTFHPMRYLDDGDAKRILFKIAPSIDQQCDDDLSRVLNFCRRDDKGFLPRILVLVGSVLKNGGTDAMNKLTPSDFPENVEGLNEWSYIGRAIQLALLNTSKPDISMHILLASCLWPKYVTIDEMLRLVKKMAQGKISDNDVRGCLQEMIDFSLCFEPEGGYVPHGVYAIDDTIHAFGKNCIDNSLTKSPRALNGVYKDLLERVSEWEDRLGKPHDRAPKDYSYRNHDDLLEALPDLNIGLLLLCFKKEVTRDCILNFKWIWDVAYTAVFPPNLCYLVKELLYYIGETHSAYLPLLVSYIDIRAEQSITTDTEMTTLIDQLESEVSKLNGDHSTLVLEVMAKQVLAKFYSKMFKREKAIAILHEAIQIAENSGSGNGDDNLDCLGAFLQTEMAELYQFGRQWSDARECLDKAMQVNVVRIDLYKTYSLLSRHAKEEGKYFDSFRCAVDAVVEAQLFNHSQLKTQAKNAMWLLKKVSKELDINDDRFKRAYQQLKYGTISHTDTSDSIEIGNGSAMSLVKSFLEELLDQKEINCDYGISFGLVPWMKINEKWHAIFQISFSVTRKDIVKIDPFRGKLWSTDETPESVASRKCYDESFHLFNVSSDVIGGEWHENLYHCRFAFDHDDTISDLIPFYEKNRSVLTRTESNISDCLGLAIIRMNIAGTEYNWTEPPGVHVSGQCRKIADAISKGSIRLNDLPAISLKLPDAALNDIGIQSFNGERFSESDVDSNCSSYKIDTSLKLNLTSNWAEIGGRKKCGTVKWFNTSAGFGVIKVEDEALEYGFRRSSVVEDSIMIRFDNLNNSLVEFIIDVDSRRNKYYALNVYVKKQPKICFYYNSRNGCQFGNRCKNAHVSTDAAQSSRDSDGRLRGNRRARPGIGFGYREIGGYKHSPRTHKGKERAERS